MGGASFPVRIENAALAPWLPFLGATADPPGADQLCLEQHHLGCIFPVHVHALYIARIGSNHNDLALSGRVYV